MWSRTHLGRWFGAVLLASRAAAASPLVPCPGKSSCRVLYDHAGTQLVEEVRRQKGQPGGGATRCTLEAGADCAYWWARARHGRAPERRLVYRGRCEDVGPADRCELGTICCRVRGGDFVLEDFDSRYTPSSETVGLDPLAMREESHALQHGAGGADLPYPHFRLHWDWSRFEGGGELVESADLRTISGCPKGAGPDAPRPMLLVPALPEPPPPGFDWRRDALGSCAVAFGGTAGRGVPLWGGPAAAREIPEVRAFLVGNTLYVDVRGWKPPADKRADYERGGGWLDSDHLELWVGEVGKDPYRYGAGPYSLAYQWGIRLSDGKVFAAYGRPQEGPLVSRASKRGPDGETVVAFEIRLLTPPFRRTTCDRNSPICAPQPNGLTLAYSSGDGEHVRQLVATSDVCYGNAASLGLAFQIPPAIASCSVKGGRLDVDRVNLAVPPADRPIVH